MLYLDHNATTPPLPAVVSAMAEALSRHWANPSSPHEAGQAAKAVLTQAREQVARFLGCQPVELVFTSGATEANHLALRGAVGHGGRNGLVVSAGEHAGERMLTALNNTGDREAALLQFAGNLDDADIDLLMTAFNQSTRKRKRR